MKIRTTYLDRAFSLYIRARDKCCQHCGRSDGLLDCAHIRSRRHVGTRWDELNALCLCRGCHMKFTVEPLDWAEWVKTVRTPEQLALIEMRSRTVTKFTSNDRTAIHRDLVAKTKALQG